MCIVSESKKVSARAVWLVCVGFQSGVLRLPFRLILVVWVRRVVISCCIPGSLYTSCFGIVSSVKCC